MNINKFTQNSMLAVQGCEKVADEYEIRRSNRSISSILCLLRMRV